jgi:hypothetical protein
MDQSFGTRPANDVLPKVGGRVSPAGRGRGSMADWVGVRMFVDDDSRVVDEVMSGERA